MYWSNGKALNGVRAGAFLGLRLPFFLFFLLDLNNIENGRGVRVSLGSSLWGLKGLSSFRIVMHAGGGTGSLRKELSGVAGYTVKSHPKVKVKVRLRLKPN